MSTAKDEFKWPIDLQPDDATCEERRIKRGSKAPDSLLAEAVCSDEAGAQ